MPDVHGTCDDRFAEVRTAFERSLAEGELGASLAVDVGGETVVDLWGGWRDEARTAPWTRDTIVNLWSTTKTITNLAVLTLVERGLLDVDAPVAEHWPEFAAHGKADVRVRHLMSHTSGVAGWDPPFTVEDMYDWELATSRLAGQAPWWEPGTASGYHASNQGHLLGEVLRRIDGRSLERYVAEELAGPLAADVRIGAAAVDDGRIAQVVPPATTPVDVSGLDPASPMVRCLTGPAVDPAVANTTAWRRADIGAANGHGNARGVVDLLRVISLGGEAGGVRLLSEPTIDRIFDVQADGVDLVLGVPLRFGLGFAIRGRTASWGGSGGSMVTCDVDRGVTISYVMNRMAPPSVGSDRGLEYFLAVYSALT